MTEYTRPENMPARVCRVLEGMTLLECDTIKELRLLEGRVYRYTHIASGLCPNPHQDWVDEFYRVEREIERLTFTSPAEKAALNTR